MTLDRNYDKLLVEESQDMAFMLAMEGGDLPPSKLKEVRQLLSAFRSEREMATKKAIEIQRRQLSVLLQDEPERPLVIRFFARWSRE